MYLYIKFTIQTHSLYYQTFYVNYIQKNDNEIIPQKQNSKFTSEIDDSSEKLLFYNEHFGISAYPSAYFRQH